jgi:2-oxo-4-hydroxy-4-carboxy-5-ureidoimidazoline decarboxylase
MQTAETAENRTMRLDDLNALDADAAARELLRCCGSSRWAAHMAAARPFSSVETMTLVGEVLWWALDELDWLEAFAAHPAIGSDGAKRSDRSDTSDRSDRSDGSDGLGGSRSDRSDGLGGSGRPDWSAQEQARVACAREHVRERLAQRNREYLARFGYIFIVCATGRSAGDMLAMLESRLTNDSGAELRIAAEEQRKITRLRLAKLLVPEEDTVT